MMMSPLHYAGTIALLLAYAEGLDLSGRYIVALKQNADIATHITFVNDIHSTASAQGNGDAFQGVSHQYNISGLYAYAGHFSSSTIAKIKSHPDVANVEDDIAMPPQTDDEGECCNGGSCDDPGQGEEDGAHEEHEPNDKRFKELQDGGKDRDHVAAPLPKPRPPPNESLTRQVNAPYNLHRISHRGMNDQGNYWYAKQAGQGSYIYFLDSGIDGRHAEFQGRVSSASSFDALDMLPSGTKPKAPSPGAHIDNDGHGTFIAGVLGGRTYGVAKKAMLVPVKVFNKRTETSLRTFLAGYDWAVRDIVSNRRIQFSVINVSQAGQASNIVNDAIDAAYNQGIMTVVPAGNKNADARNTSPASSLRAITVGATTSARTRYRLSNWGARVNIFAPGARICSAWIGASNRKIRRGSGTAEAGAHVAGLIAYLKSYNHLRTAETTWQFMQVTSIPGVVKNARSANDLFAYNFSGK